MVCRKCGMIISDKSKSCPYCGVGINEEKKEKLNVELNNIIEDLEKLKMHEDSDNKSYKDTKAEIVNDQVLEDVVENILDNKDLFISDKKNEKEEQSTNLDNIFPTYDFEPDDNTIEPDEDDIYKIEDNNDFEDNSSNESFEFSSTINTSNNKRNINVNKYAIIVPIVAIVLFISVFIIYKTSFSSKARFFKAIDVNHSEFTDLLEDITNHYSIIKNKDLISVSSTSNISETINNESKNRTVETKYIQDKENNKQYFEYNNDNNKTIAFIQNNKFYINQENSTENFYITNSKYIDLLNTLNVDNIDYLKEIIVDSIKSDIDENDFKSSNVTESYNNKNYKLKRVVLELSEIKFNNMLKKILNSINTNANAISIIERNSKYSLEEIKTILKRWNKELSEAKSNDIIFRYYVYIDNSGNIIRQKIEYQDLNIEYLNLDNERNINIKYKDDEYKIDIKNNNNKISLNLKYNLDKEINLQFSQKDNKYICNYQINKYLQNDTTKKSKTVNIISYPSTKDNIYTNNLTINVESNLNDTDVIQTINMTNVIEQVKEFPSFDINNSNKIKLMDNESRNKYKEYFSYFLK